MNLYKKFLLSILSLQEKFLLKKLNRTIGIKNHSKRKKHFHSGCSLTLESLANEEKQKFEDEILLILKKTDFNPIKILEYIKKQGTNVYFINNSNYLHSINENEGFIHPQTGVKALYLSLLTEHKLSFKTKPMFILAKGEINKYYFIYHFYNWYAFKNNIQGLDNYSQNLLKKYLFNTNDEAFSKLHLTDIYKLKDAIKQDKASIEFVLKLCQVYECSQKALDKIKNNGANI